MEVITFPVNLNTTSCLSILLHGFIPLPDPTSYDNIYISLFALMLYIPVNNFSVMLIHFPEFLSKTSTMQRIKCLVQGHNTEIPGDCGTVTFNLKINNTTEPVPFSCISNIKPYLWRYSHNSIYGYL